MKAQVAAAYLGISVSLLQAKVKAGLYPTPIRPSAGRVVWLKEDLDSLIDSLAGRAKADRRSPEDDPSGGWDDALRGNRAA